MSSARSNQNLSDLSDSISSIPPPRGGNLITFDQPLLGSSSRVGKTLCSGPLVSSSRCKQRKLNGLSIPDVSSTCSPRIPPPHGGNLLTFDPPLLGSSSRITKMLCPEPN